MDTGGVHLAASVALRVASLALSGVPLARAVTVVLHVALTVAWVAFGGCVLTQNEARDALPADAVPASSHHEHPMFCGFRKPKAVQAALGAAGAAGLLLIAIRDRRPVLRFVAGVLAAVYAVAGVQAWLEVPADYCERYGRRDASSLVALAAPLP